ncbi:chemotaxis protein CheB [Flavitalea antarctica]
MEKRNIIVIGASAGGFEAIKRLVADLPPDLDAAIFIVWHMSPDITGILPQVLNRGKTVFAANAIDNEPIVFNRIYVAPPDRHLVLEKDVVRVTRGPKENRFRPAVDPLFRSAALIYGSRVIGIVLSGGLDDGTAGLWTIKNRGGIAIVQDPQDAEVSSMPANALKAVHVDYQVPLAEMGSLIVQLSQVGVIDDKKVDMEESKKTELEVRIAVEEPGLEIGILSLGKLTRYACPDCHGVLAAINDGDIVRYRCHTGHAYSAAALLNSLSGNIENSLWSAIRGIEESIILLNNLGDHYAEKNQLTQASMYFKKAKEAEEQARLTRRAVFDHEQVTPDSISTEVKQDDQIG